MRTIIPRLKPKPARALQRVPPSPSLLLDLYTKWSTLKKNGRLSKNLTFDDFFSVWSSGRRSENFVGLDDGNKISEPAEAPQLIARPPSKLSGLIKTIVLLVDFSDQPHEEQRDAAFFQQKLFGDLEANPGGSMAEYYRTISNYKSSGGMTGIDVEGAVFGWFRMPFTSDYYSNSSSGMGDYPRNLQGLAEHALQEAVRHGVDFGPFDSLKDGTVTSLCIVHSGRGAEDTGNRNGLWSLKWLMQNNVTVGENLVVNAFLTIPEDGHIGVCIHEWGHLVPGWADFYDTGGNKDERSNGLGNYCLMATGCWNNFGMTPGLPNGMLRMFHDWIKPVVVNETTLNIILKPAAESGSIVMIRNPSVMLKPEQYIFVEYRRRKGQDIYLPDEGVAIYVVDESIDNVNDETNLAIELIQADNLKDLAAFPPFGNRGDINDLYPSTVNGEVKSSVGKSTKPALNLQNGIWSGISIKIKGSPGDATMSIDVVIG